MLDVGVDACALVDDTCVVPSTTGIDDGTTEDGEYAARSGADIDTSTTGDGT